MIKTKNINWAIADQVMVSGANFITGIIIARLLGLDLFGQFTMLWLCALFLSSIQEALLLSPMVSITAKLTKIHVRKYLNGIVNLSIAYCLLIASIMILAVLTLPTLLSTVQLPMTSSYIFAIIFFLLQDMYRRYFYAIKLGKLAFINDAISYIGQISMLLSFVYFYDDLTLYQVFLCIGLSSFLAVIFCFIVTHKTTRYKNYWLQYSLNTWRRNWPIAKWMLSSALANWLTGNLFIITAGAFLGTSAVGALKSAQNILGINHILFKVIENIAPIKASELLIKNGTVAMFSYLKKITLISSLCFAFVTLITMIFKEEIMTYVYGAEFTQYSWLLVGFALIYFFMLLTFPLRICLRTLEKTKYIFYAFLASSVFTLITVQTFVLSMGMVGVISGMLIVNIMMVILLFVS